MAESTVSFESNGLDGNSIQLADASASFSDEVTALRLKQENTSFVELSPNQGDGLWAVARQAYKLAGNDNPTPTEVKALAHDIASRNEIPVDTVLDQDQKLMVKMPGRIDGSGGTRRVQNSEAQAEPVKVAKAKTANPHDGPSCSSSWEEVNMIASWVTQNEAGHKSYTAFNPDDNGAGISVGLMQWNQEKGLLPELVDQWHSKNPTKFNRVFGANATNMLDESWLRSVDFSNSSDLTDSMKQALGEPEFQQVQLRLRNEHIEESCEIARDYGFGALRGRAVVADLVNQLGKGGTRRFLSKVPLSGNESHRIEQLKSVTDDRVNAADRISVIEEQVRKVWRGEALAQH